MYLVKSSYATLTPEGILPILENDEFFKSRHNKITERALVFCTVLNLHHFYYKDKGTERNPFQQISTDLVIKILARDNYKEILARLEELGIIQVYNSYRARNYPKSYRITQFYYKQKNVARRIQCTAIQKSVQELSDYFASKHLEEYKYLLPLYRNFEKISIDVIAAMEWVENNRNELSEGVINNYLCQIQKIQWSWARRLSVSETNHRLHSTFTAFPKKLRRFLGVVDKKTGEMSSKHCTIDGCNTQPLMICVEMEQDGAIVDKDYKEFCIAGTLYDTMASELEETKDWVKEMMMTAILFTPTNSDYTHRFKNPCAMNAAKKKLSGYFKGRFPLIYQWLLTKKLELKDSGQTTKNFRNKGGSLLAYGIQQMEAELWVHQLLKEIPEDMVFVTIHDAVMIFNHTEDQVAFVESKIKEVGKRLYGIEVPLKKEYSIGVTT